MSEEQNMTCDETKTNAQRPKELHAVLTFCQTLDGKERGRDNATGPESVSNPDFYDEDSLTAFSFMVPAIFLPIS